MVGEYRAMLRIIDGGRRFAALLVLRAPFDAANTILHALFLQQAFRAVH